MTLAAGISDVFRGFPQPAPGRPGDPGLFGPGSIAWRLSGETVTILGGGRALLMQIAHPMVAAGVADHSDFEADGFARLWRTLDAVLNVVFGDAEQAVAAANHVTEIHRKVVGTRNGTSYRALDPDLLLWVHATLVDTALVTYDRFVGPVTPSERERYYQEMKRFASTFRVPEEVLPDDLPAFQRYLADTMAGLEVTAEARRLARGILAPPVSRPLLPLRALLREATVGLLPPRLRDGFGLSWTPARERALRASAWAIRRTLPAVPAKMRRWPHARAGGGRSVGRAGE